MSREGFFKFSQLVRLGLFYFACSVALLAASWGLITGVHSAEFVLVK